VDRFFFALLAFVPITIIANYLHASPVTIFFLAALSIVPLAKYIGEATEELATHTTPAVAGLLNATFGNAPELIIGLFALHAGLFDLVKASLTGSIISNLLLVLGVAMFAGGWGKVTQLFNRTAVVASGSTLFLVTIALIMPALFVYTEPNLSQSVTMELSVIVSIALLIVYAASLFFSLRTHKHLYFEEVGKYETRWSVQRSLLTLAVTTLVVACMSDLLVGSVQPLVQALGWSQLFIGIVVIAIIGNAAEHYSAVVVALKDRMDLSLQISIGSAAQIAMLVAPLLVLISFAFGQPMNLVFDPFELVSIALSVLIVNLVVADGESNWFEGVQLLAGYAIIAIAFFFHP